MSLDNGQHKIYCNFQLSNFVDIARKVCTSNNRVYKFIFTSFMYIHDGILVQVKI